jgi:hypothetical protein
MSKHVQRGLLWALVTFATLLAAPLAAPAATITVTTAADVSASACTLRDAIEAANGNSAKGACPTGQAAPPDVIEFDLAPASTITLASPLPLIAQAAEVLGPGAGQLSVSGGDAVGIFSVGEGVSARIAGLTLAHGRCGFGCALVNDGTLTLDRVAVAHNGAVVEGGTNAFPEGGGIINRAAGVLTVTDSAIEANTAKGSGASNQNGPQGGGIYNVGSLTIERSTVSGNSVLAVAGPGGTTHATGGGIANFGTLVLAQSTLSGNTAGASGSTTNNGAEGAGISNANSAKVKVTIDRSTISGNSVSASGANPQAEAGGFNVFGSLFAVDSATIAGNSAAAAANVEGGAVATFRNTIVANPLGGGGSCTGAPTSLGYNLDSGSSCGFALASDQASTNPLLAAGLADNGGPTPTIALLAASPATDRGLSSAGAIVDQRGLTRPVEIPGLANAPGGDGTDVGAFEQQLPVVVPPLPDPAAEPASGLSPPPTIGLSPPTIDGRQPVTTIRKLKAATAKRVLKIRFRSSLAGSSFRCSLDHRPPRPCSSPYTTKTLALGSHSFAVTATSGSGVVGVTARKKFLVVAVKK